MSPNKPHDGRSCEVGTGVRLDWRVDAGQHVAKLGPFTFIAFHSDDPDRKQGETHVLAILREGRTVAISDGADSIAEAKALLVPMLRVYVASEKKLLERLAAIVG